MRQAAASPAISECLPMLVPCSRSHTISFHALLACCSHDAAMLLAGCCYAYRPGRFHAAIIMHLSRQIARACCAVFRLRLLRCYLWADSMPLLCCFQANSTLQLQLVYWQAHCVIHLHADAATKLFLRLSACGSHHNPNQIHTIPPGGSSCKTSRGCAASTGSQQEVHVQSE